MHYSLDISSKEKPSLTLATINYWDHKCIIMNVYKTFESAIDMFGIVGILTNNKSLSGTNITKTHPDANGSCQLNGAKHTN